MTAGTARESGTREVAALRIGGWLGLIGGLGYFALLLVHGDLPDHTTEAALEHIAGRREWALLKWLLIASAFCWLGAFHLVGHALRGAMSWVLARLAAAFLMVGTALVLVEYSVLGMVCRKSP